MADKRTYRAIAAGAAIGVTALVGGCGKDDRVAPVQSQQGGPSARTSASDGGANQSTGSGGGSRQAGSVGDTTLPE